MTKHCVDCQFLEIVQTPNDNFEKMYYAKCKSKGYHIKAQNINKVTCSIKLYCCNCNAEVQDYHNYCFNCGCKLTFKDKDNPKKDKTQYTIITPKLTFDNIMKDEMELEEIRMQIYGDAIREKMKGDEYTQSEWGFVRTLGFMTKD